MKSILICFCSLLLILFCRLDADPLREVVVQGVNIATGEVQEGCTHEGYGFYLSGMNETYEGEICLAQDDFRIGSVRTFRMSLQNGAPFDIYFSYDIGSTSVFYPEGRLTIYRYNDDRLITAIEDYSKDDSGSWKIDRSERFYWNQNGAEAFLSSRVFHDSSGEAIKCIRLHSNLDGEIIGETLYGNLSGDCQVNCLIDPEGIPLDNGVESFYHSYNSTQAAIRSSFNGDKEGKHTISQAAVPETEWVDEEGNATYLAYDPYGRLKRIMHPEVLNEEEKPWRPTEHFSYNIFDQIEQIQNDEGASTFFHYNLRGSPVEIRYPDGSTEYFRYFLNGDLKEKKTREGSVINFKRDDSGRLIGVEKYSPSGKMLQALEYRYDSNRVSSITDGSTFTARLIYDQSGEISSIVCETDDGVRSYTAKGNPDSVQDKLPEWFNPGQDSLVPCFETQNCQNDSEFVCVRSSLFQNKLGQTVKQEELIDGYGKRSILTYDAMGRVENKVHLNSFGVKNSEISYRYDSSGNVLLERYVGIGDDGQERSYCIRRRYDSCGRPTKLLEEGGGLSKTTEIIYDQAGRIIQKTKPDGISIHYLYDEEGLVKQIFATDHSFNYRYDYDEQQRICSVRDLKFGTMLRRKYNAFQELVSEEQSPDIKICYEYDPSGRQAAIILPEGSKICYRYQGSLLSSVERVDRNQALKYVHTYEYDSKGLLTTSNLAKGVGSVDFQYDLKGNLAGLSSPWLSQEIESTGRDPYGRLSMMRVKDIQGSRFCRFDYSDDGQLLTEEEIPLSYDAFYNRLGDEEHPWEINGLHQLVNTHEASYSYDQNGNVTKKRSSEGIVNFFYDALDRLVRVEKEGTFALTYLYDSFNRRIEEKTWKWVKEDREWRIEKCHKFMFDGFKEIGTINEMGDIDTLRILGQGKGADIGSSIAMELKDKLFVPIHDLQGSIRCLIDTDTGSPEEYYTFTPFGRESIWDKNGNSLPASEVGNPWRYFSKRKNELSGLVFFGKRDYDPVIGRWTTPDPLLHCDTCNLYAFTRNDPINCRDFYGLFSVSNVWDHFMNGMFTGFHYLQVSAHQLRARLSAELKLPESVRVSLEKMGKTLFGEPTYLLMGPHYEETTIDCYGEREMSDKVRVTFINGILNTRSILKETLEVISESHGGVKIYYVFRPTEGWTWDISRAVIIKTAYTLGFRSLHAHLLAGLWRALIRDMGGVNGGGTIVHYAHSLGGSETDRARELLSLEEQKMIRVITFGSSTLIRNEGFQFVTNNVSVNDGVSSIFLEPFGHIRNVFDPDSNVRFHGSFFTSPYWPTDHLLSGSTYSPIIRKLGEEFVTEFSEF